MAGSLPAFAFRYTLEDDLMLRSKVLDWVKKEFENYVVIQHDADREVTATHWHALLRSGKKITAIRQSLKYAHPGLDKTMYSLKVCKEGDEEVYERYMCHSEFKGAPVTIVASQGLKYTQEWGREQNRAFWDEQAKFVAGVKSKDKMSTVDELLAECKAVRVCTVREVIELSVRMWKRQHRAVQEHYMASVIKAVCLQLEIGHYNSQGLANRLENLLLS